MRTASKSIALVLIALFLTSLVASPTATVKAQSKTIVVPDDYPTIQDAIGNASAGDTVFVKQGIYNTYTDYTHQLTVNKPLTLIGENPNITILDGTKKSKIFTGESPYHPYVFLSLVNITSSDVTLSGFTIKNCDTAIILTDTGKEPISRIKITGNNIINSSRASGSFYGSGYAITHVGEEASNVLISQNNITGNSGTGISTSGQRDSSFIITNNNISSNEAGIILHASNSLIENNNIFQNDITGITISSSNNVTVKNNVINGNGAANFAAHYYGYLNNSGGLLLAFSQSCFVYNNNIIGNHRYGLMVEGINNTIVKSNAILDNGAGIRLINYVYGGRFFTLHSLGTGSLVYNNNFVGNTPNALIDSSGPFYMSEGTVGNGTDLIAWDNGVAGNYWSDYNGQGEYIINQNNLDRHPLAQRVDISVPVTPPLSQINATFIVTITFALLIAVAITVLVLYRRHRKTSE